jgi:Tfp pilus assembly protein PilE
MTVITIIGVLAGIAGLVYTNTANKAKLTSLRQYTLDVANGQKNYHARNSDYVEPTCSYKRSMSSTTCENKFSQLLDFSPEIKTGYKVRTEKGDGSSNCDWINSNVSSSVPCTSFSSSVSHRWFAVTAWADFDNDGTDAIVYFDSESSNPMTVSMD